MAIKRFKKVNFKEKKVFKIYDISIDKILVSKEEPYGSNKSMKCFIGYNDDNRIRPAFIILPQMIGYVKYFESNNTMSFNVNDKKLLKK